MQYRPRWHLELTIAWMVHRLHDAAHLKIRLVLQLKGVEDSTGRQSASLITRMAADATRALHSI